MSDLLKTVVVMTITGKAEHTLTTEQIENQIAAAKSEQHGKLIAPSLISLAKQAIGDSVPSKEIILALIDKVYVFPDKRIEIVWKIADFE